MSVTITFDTSVGTITNENVRLYGSDTDQLSLWGADGSGFSRGDLGQLLKNLNANGVTNTDNPVVLDDFQNTDVPPVFQYLTVLRQGTTASDPCSLAIMEVEVKVTEKRKGFLKHTRITTNLL